MRSKAKTIPAYLASLPADRRSAVSKVRQHINRHLPKGYSEEMEWGMITWSIPLKRYPTTYNGRPLCYAALASQKNNCSLYLMGPYGSKNQAARLKEGFTKAGKTLVMGGKSCLHFQTAEDLELGVIGELIASTSPEAYIAFFEATRPKSARKRQA